MKRFSIVIVCLNPGDKLNDTIDSILRQTFTDFEIVVKDGISKDGSLENIRTDERIHVTVQLDKSIYDAMNQAIEKASGEYLLFLNCGDTFYDAEVLAKTAKYIEEMAGKGKDLRLFYGNTYCEKTKAMVHSAPKITGFTCYRNIPCHQSCFYARELFEEKKYETELKIRADYDHFLWCFYRAGVVPVYMDMTVAAYEGDGFSENPENKKRDKEEHELIIKRYMRKHEIRKYKLLMALTLVSLRKRIAESSVLSGAYHALKNKIYSK